MFLQAIALATKAAKSNVPVLLHGETGTGKDLLATAIHNASSRAARRMVVAPVAEGSDNLQTSALFGHTKGAFTGAQSSHRGFFREADGGTLFLNEVGDYSPPTQLALLRAIEQKRFRPLGAEEDVDVDVRIICATHRDLGAMRTTGTFREDLYYRIAVWPIEVPPLRERPQDIPLLVLHFMREISGDGRALPEIEPDALAALSAYRWPGNIRELRNVVERMMLLSAGETIRRDHCSVSTGLEPDVHVENTRDLSLKEAQIQFETAYLKDLLARYGGNTQAVAEHAGVDVTTIRRKIRELGLSKTAT
jgi:DNA-binding NtrC family response regulator